MNVRTLLSDSQWLLIQPLLFQPGPGRPGIDDRRFVEAVLWWRRTGVPWRDLPSDFGPWKSVFNRFDRWSKKGRWTLLFTKLKTDPDLEWHSLDSTTNRAHQHASGGKGGPNSRPSDAPEAASPRKYIWS
jgi:transposase